LAQPERTDKNGKVERKETGEGGEGGLGAKSLVPVRRGLSRGGYLSLLYWAQGGLSRGRSH